MVSITINLEKTYEIVQSVGMRLEHQLTIAGIVSTLLAMMIVIWFKEDDDLSGFGIIGYIMGKIIK